MIRAIEKCNGSADCHKLHWATGGMCPSYQASLDEKILLELEQMY